MYKLKTAPAFSPVSLSEVKRNLHISSSDVDAERDALIEDLILDAVAVSQNVTGRQYCRATYTMYHDAYQSEINIDRGPVVEITSVKYYAPGSAVLTTLSSTLYQLDNIGLTARLRFLESFEVDTNKMNVIEIEFTCGWDTALSVPAEIKQAIILRSCDSYLNPGNDPQNFGFGIKLKVAELKERDYKIQRY